jgi:hypothetical protein
MVGHALSRGAALAPPPAQAGGSLAPPPLAVGAEWLQGQPLPSAGGALALEGPGAPAGVEAPRQARPAPEGGGAQGAAQPPPSASEPTRPAPDAQTVLGAMDGRGAGGVRLRASGLAPPPI